MWLLPRALFLFICAQLAQSLHESEVGVVDWHKKLVGVPVTRSRATAPVFHRVGTEVTRSLILTATGSNVLAALDPANGTVVWRYLYESSDPITTFHAYKNVVISLSGPGGVHLRVFDSLSGHLLVEKRLHNPSLSETPDPPYLGSDLAFIREPSRDASDIFTLTDGTTLKCLSSKTGDQKWTTNWTWPESSSPVTFSRIIPTSSTIYVVGLRKSFSDFMLHVAAHNPSNGMETANADIISLITDQVDDLMIVRYGNESETAFKPAIVWLEKGSLKSVPLEPRLKARPSAIKGSVYKSIIDIGLSEHGRFLAVKADGSTRLFKLDSNGGLKSIHEYSSPEENAAAPIFAGGLDKNGYAYVSRIRWSQTLKQVVVDLYSGHLAKGLTTGFSFPFDTKKHGIINHATMDCANPKDLTVVCRMLLTTSTGAVQLWQHDNMQWTREESLSTIAVAQFVELPEKVVASSRVRPDQETFIGRLTRQLADAQDFPQYALKFARRFATGSYESASSSATVVDDEGVLSRDMFGFRQVIVVATPYATVYGIDSSNGEILWSRNLGLGWATETGGSVQPLRLHVTRTVADGGSPQVVLVTQRRAENTLTDTVVFHIDATNGRNVIASANDDNLLEGLDLVPGPLVECFPLPGKAKAVILVDEHLQLYVYPDTPETQKALRLAAPSFHFPLKMRTDGYGRVVGHQIRDMGVGGRFVAYQTWHMGFANEEDLVTIIPAERGPIASFGKVLGNRTTLYKYLNPRLFITLTVTDTQETQTCRIKLVDAAKGAIVYSTSLPLNEGECDVQVVLAENWLVYHYWDPNFTETGTTKGYRLVTVELYEGSQADDKTRSSEISAFSEDIMDVTSFEQAYVYPRGITAITTTSTKFGISTKDVIVATDNHKIQAIPRRLLNPRRPNRKTTAEEQEEFLIPYDPVIADDPRRTLSHHYEVANIQNIITAPSLLESTSLVFAYGQDLFLTRVAPSNTFDVLSENFNKLQLVLTVVALGVAIMVTKPMVRRKRLRERWYQ